MSKFKVVQEVQCVVRVWYELECDNLEKALYIIGENYSPTDRSIDGTDYEIISDDKILSTKVEAI